MSVSIVILKEIEGFSLDSALLSVRRAAGRAGLHCIGVTPYANTQSGVSYLEGTLSEVDAAAHRSNFQRGIPTRQCGFSLEEPGGSSYDSFTWLIHKRNYFRAFDLQYLGGDYEFAFRFLKEYFWENRLDYLWVDDVDWFYAPEEMAWLIRQPYRPEWVCQKLTAGSGGQ